MATKKPAGKPEEGMEEAEVLKTEAAEIEKPEEKAEEPAGATAEKPKDEWDEIVEMIVPRKPKGDDQSYYICVNDRRFYVPADGKRQKLPRPVAEILQSSLEAEYAAEDYAERMSSGTL